MFRYQLIKKEIEMNWIFTETESGLRKCQQNLDDMEGQPIGEYVSRDEIIEMCCEIAASHGNMIVVEDLNK